MTTTFAHAESVYVDDDEGRFQLHVHTSDGDHLIFDIHASALEFYDNVDKMIGDYGREADQARRTVAAGVPLPVFTKTVSVEDAVEAGYALDDPKSPGYYERMVGDA